MADDWRTLGRRRQPSRVGPFLIGVLATVGVLYALSTLRSRIGRFQPDAVPRHVDARGDLAADEKSTIDLFRSSSPSVVFVTTLARRAGLWMDVSEIPAGSGSGIVWDASGYIVTNFHVIADADSIRVTLSDHTTHRAAFVGADPSKEVAVIKITPAAGARALTPIPVGTSKDLQVGQKVFAIGNPFGLDQTLTTGIVSALGRRIQSMSGRNIEGVVQTDAAINPGNSGGPLLDSAGRLIGINTAIASPSGASAGIGFAVPVDTVNMVVPQLIQHGKVTRPRLGVELLNDSLAQRLGVQGALIGDVLPGSPAERAQLRGTRRDEDGNLTLGDVVQRFGEDDVKEAEDLLNALEKRKAGDRVRLQLLRDGAKVDVEVVLEPGE